MKKIGIITIHNSPNYGACLQSYALYKYIEQQGDDVEIIDLHRPGANDDYVPSKRFKPSRQKSEGLVGKLKRKVKSFVKYKQVKSKDHYSALAYIKFEKFNAKIKLSKAYKSIDDLYKNPPKYELYISGSDQLWNPSQPYCIEPYFLTFVPPNTGRKISYGTSVGLSELQKNEKEQFQQWLMSYDGISVREKQTQEYLQSFVHKPIERVADPTFLLDVSYWKSIMHSPAEKESYILLFSLSPNIDLLRYCLELAEQSEKKLIVLGQLEQDDITNRYEVVNDAGPREFLGYISNSDMVITNSFHCTVFSIITGAKNFYAYIAPNNNRGVRIIDLLDVFGLNKHLLDNRLCQDFEELASNRIDRNGILQKIKEEKTLSELYLKKYL